MELEGCVKYALSKQDVKEVLSMASKVEIESLLGVEYWEIWEGLPGEYFFELAVSRGGLLSWKAEVKGVSIWVGNETKMVVERSPNSVLFALGGRKEGFLEFTYVTVSLLETIQDAIIYAKELNYMILLDVWEGLLKKRWR